MPAHGENQNSNNLGDNAEAESQMNQVRTQRKSSLESTVVIEMLENMPAYLARGVVYLLIFIIFAGFAYSYFGKMDVVVKARGKLIPEGYAEVVQPATNGILKTIHVKEGDMVEKGDLLADLDITKSNVNEKKRKTQLKQMLKKIDCLETALKVMKSVLAGETIYIDDNAVLKLCSSEYVTSIVSLKAARMAYDKAIMQAKKLYPGSLLTLESGVRNKKMSLANKKVQLSSALKDLDRAKKQYELYKTMFDQGLSSKVKLFEEQKKYDEAVGKVDENKVALDSAKAELEDAQVKLAASRTNYDNSNKESKITYDLEVLKHNNKIKTMNDRLENLKIGLAGFHLEDKVLELQKGYNRITAPVAGRVTFVKFRTPGEIVKTGTTVFMINPGNQPLVAKIEIPNKSIGRIQPGLKVKIKFDAFPYQHYGILTGTILRVASDSKKIGPIYFFEATVSLDRAYVTKNEKQYPLFTGLTLLSEIVVEQKRIIEKLIDPIKKLKG